jgi:hypothetical protein
MTSILTWYDVLGVLPDAPQDDIRQAWQARKAALRPGILAGAAPEVQSAASGPDVLLGEGWSMADEQALEAYSDRPSRVLVPDVRGLFYQVCMEVAGRVGLHLAPIRLTPHPMPVEGLVVGQAPAPGQRAHRNSTLTVQLWHPSESRGQQPADNR